MPHYDESTLAFRNLEPEQILATLENLGFDCDGRLLTLNSYENRVYRLGIESGDPVVAKFYRPGRWSDDQILEEHEFSAELASMDIPVVPPIRVGGETLHHSGYFRVPISPCWGGRAPELDDKKLMQQLGRLIARIHLIGEQKSFIHRERLNTEDYGVGSAAFLLNNDFIPAEMTEVYQGVTTHLFTEINERFRCADDIKEIRLHGDFHCSNVLVNSEQLHIVDLDDARTGPAIQDLWMLLSGDYNEQTPQLANLLEGYAEFRNFDARELQLVEALRALRIIYYAGWLARRWQDPAFQIAFPWFNSRRYWDEHILSLREQVALMNENPLSWNE